MPTVWYCDYEGGTNANASVGNGDSFATRRKTIDNCVAAAIAPGDTIRVMASPTPTSIGNATWTGNYLLPTVAITSSTNATPIVVTKAAHGLVTGDTVIIAQVSGNTNANGTFTVTYVTADTFSLDGSVGNGTSSGGNFRKVNNCVVTLATACTANIALCGQYRGGKPNWTGADANNVPTITQLDYKIGNDCLQIAIAAGMTTGLSAYYATGTLDLSGYQQVSFWIKQTAGTLGAANSLSIKLCSDTAGATPVNTINIPYIGALNQWSPIVVDTGGALGSSIQSIALYVNTDNGAQTFLLDNIIACKASSAADSLNLTSLISKDSGDHSFGDGYECYWGIQSINGTRVMLDGTTNTIPSSSPQRGYTGTTETVTTYKRETTKTLAATSSANVQSLQDNGTAGNLITFSGGWNRTDMSAQTQETWFDGQNGNGYAIQANAKTFTLIDKINAVRYSYGYTDGSGTDQSIGRLETCNLSFNPVTNTGQRLTATTISAVACGGAITPGTGAVVTTIGRADSVGGSGQQAVTLGISSVVGTIVSASNNLNYGVLMGLSSYLGTVTAKYNDGRTLILANNCTVGYAALTGSNLSQAISASAMNAKILGGYSTGHTGGLYCYSSGGISVSLRNFTINEATEFVSPYDYSNTRIYSDKHDGTAGNTQIFCDGGLISQQASVVHSTCASSWKFSPTSTNRAANYPLNLPIAQIAVNASALVTCTAWFRRSNTGLTGRLVCKGGQLAGVASDVVASMTVAADTWESLSITFTPTESGVIELEAQFYGGSSYNGYVSIEDASFTQA